MTTETETANVQPDVSSEDAKVLARVLFKAQKVKNKDVAEEVEEVAFKDAKKELMPVARRMLKILARQGYTLSKSGD